MVAICTFLILHLSAFLFMCYVCEIEVIVHKRITLLSCSWGFRISLIAMKVCKDKHFILAGRCIHSTYRTHYTVVIFMGLAHCLKLGQPVCFLLFPEVSLYAMGSRGGWGSCLSIKMSSSGTSVSPLCKKAHEAITWGSSVGELG